MNCVLILEIATALALNAQWMSYPTPGIPRTADGKPILTAPPTGDRPAVSLKTAHPWVAAPAS